LANALPDIPDHPENEAATAPSKIKYKSLKSKPGAMKKKELLVQMEKERFNRNMAVLQQGNEDTTLRGEVNDDAGRSRQKWAALREFIQQNMETQPDSGLVNAGHVTSHR
jgi:hypothetical protein